MVPDEGRSDQTGNNGSCFSYSVASPCQTPTWSTSTPSGATAAQRFGLAKRIPGTYSSALPPARSRWGRSCIHGRRYPLTRQGRTHRPFYRVVAIDQRNHREGRASEILGTYDPLLADKNISVDIERVHAWIRTARRSVKPFVAPQEARLPAPPGEVNESRDKKRANAKKGRQTRAKKDGKKFVAASRRAKNAHAKKLKDERKAKAAAELEAHKAKAAEAEAAAAEAEAADAPAEEAPAENAES